MAPTSTSSAVDTLKAELKALAARRSELEQEINLRSARLKAAGVGMDAPLVDTQGYPRADVDVAAVRADRHQVIVLSNDHKALTSEMEKLLHQLHEQSQDANSALRHAQTQTGPRAAATPAAAAAAPATAVGAEMAEALQPFAVVDEVAPASPASSAGIQLGDQLCRFGHATADSGPSALQAVAAELQANVGRPVRAVFLRAGVPTELQLTPRPWGGRGLLGCHLQPL